MNDIYLFGNEEIEEAIEVCNTQPSREHFFKVLDLIRRRMNHDGCFLIPVEIQPEISEMVDREHFKNGDELELREGTDFVFRKVTTDFGTQAIVAFTSDEEFNKGKCTASMYHSIADFFETVLSVDDVDGVLLNPWGNAFLVTKDWIEVLFTVNAGIKAENKMYFSTDDITNEKCSCIVNVTDKTLLGNTDHNIHRVAGPKLAEACRNLGGCHTGQAKITDAYRAQSKCIIHTVEPVYSGSPRDALMIRKCYWNSLELAKENGIHNIAFPIISTQAGEYPPEKAIPIAIMVISNWWEENPYYGMAVHLVCEDEKISNICKAFMKSVGMKNIGD